MYSKSSLVGSQARPLSDSRPALRTERALMGLARSRHWSFRVLGVAPVPTQPLFLNHWWLVPIAEDRSAIPARALERVQANYASGIRPKTFIIAHEAPPQLPAPAGVHMMSRAEFWLHRLGDFSIAAAKVTGIVLATVVIPLTLAVAGVGVLAIVGLASIALTDPCLIAVTEDNVWIQIDAWMV